MFVREFLNKECKLTVVGEYFEFKLGKNLEGRVLIFSKFHNVHPNDITITWLGNTIVVKKGETGILAKYVTIDTRDLAEKSGVPKENIEEKVREYEETAREHFQNDDEGDCKNSSFYWYGKFVRIENEEGARAFDSNVLFVGEHEYPVCCNIFIDKAEKMYFAQLSEQVGVLAKLGNLSDFAGASIKEEISKTYVVPMMKARVSGNRPRFIILEGKFCQFSRGSLFEQDVRKLCAILREYSAGKINTALVGAYVEKIDAIHTEDYERAQELVRVIASLEG